MFHKLTNKKFPLLPKLALMKIHCIVIRGKFRATDFHTSMFHLSLANGLIGNPLHIIGSFPYQPNNIDVRGLSDFAKPPQRTLNSLSHL